MPGRKGTAESFVAGSLTELPIARCLHGSPTGSRAISCRGVCVFSIFDQRDFRRQSYTRRRPRRGWGSSLTACIAPASRPVTLCRHVTVGLR